MGNSSRAAVDAAKRRKKKGRPSLLDLQKRSLRLQNQQQQQNDHVPNPNPYLRFPQSTSIPSSSSARRATRQNAEASLSHEDEDEEEDGGSRGKRREKKLKLVLRLPSRSAGSASESDADPKRRDAALGSRDKKDERNKSSKSTDSVPGGQSDLGPATPLPDKKLLTFVLDRLQKKDTYGVFSEPVDPEELPDYHEIIEHPMDFGTVRKKLYSGAYTTLEQFENDVFLISSNAMCYNAPDTIYYRQARSIQELAKKNFENLRQESDDNEPEAKTVVRRGRPPNKNKKIGRPPADRAALNFSSDATLSNSEDITHWSNLTIDKARKGTGEKPGKAVDEKADRNDEYSGSTMKVIPAKYGKKPIIVDENRRDTYKMSLMSTCSHGSPVFTLDGQKKQLVLVGLHSENAYARSLARFAAKLGPIGWDLAAKKIQKVLPHGTKFGPGWVGDSEAPQLSQPSLQFASPADLSAKPCSTSSTDKSIDEGHFSRTLPSTSTSSAPIKPFSLPEYPFPNRSNHENGKSSSDSGGADNSTIQPHHQIPVMQQTANGFNTSANVNRDSELDKMIRPPGIQPGNFGSEGPVRHAQVALAQSLYKAPIDNSKTFICQTTERSMSVDNCSSKNSSSPLPGPGGGSKIPWQSMTLQTTESIPPDLNVGFHSPGSPTSGVVLDSQRPDLTLQL